MGFPNTAPWLRSLQKKLKKPMALFLDFDGTLVPIVQHPDHASLDHSVRRLLRFLSRHIPVVIVSGRALGDLKSRVALPGLICVGNHGLEMSGRALKYRMKNAIPWRRFINKLGRELKEELGEIPGVLIENKGYTLSVHYRKARKAGRRRSTRLFMARLGPLVQKGEIRISHGKAVWEVRPPIDWHKGRAVRWILKQSGFKGRWPLYIGDDKTDQDAFRAIQNTGLGMMVGSPKKRGAAHYTIENPRKVQEFLRWLLDQLSTNRPFVSPSIKMKSYKHLASFG
jgi:trehalose-phosphatase